MATSNDRGYLIYEPVYNGTPVIPTNSWVTENITTSSNLWLRQFSPGQSLEVFNITLGQWQAGGVNTSANPAITIAPGPNSLVYGISTGTGSGWNGSYAMGVDNVKIGFGPAGLADPTVYNFELAQVANPVPAPPAALLGLLGVGSVGAIRRFRRASV